MIYRKISSDIFTLPGNDITCKPKPQRIRGVLVLLILILVPPGFRQTGGDHKNKKNEYKYDIR